MKYSKYGGDDEMQSLLKNMGMERMGKPLDVLLQRDREFMESRMRYHLYLINISETTRQEEI